MLIGYEDVLWYVAGVKFIMFTVLAQNTAKADGNVNSSAGV